MTDRATPKRDLRCCRFQITPGIIGLAVLAALFAAGCGGSDGDSANQKAALTSDNFTEQVDAACQARINAAASLPPASGGQVAEGAQNAGQINQKLVSDLKALKPPADQEAAYDDLVGALEQTGRNIQKAPSTSQEQSPADAVTQEAKTTSDDLDRAVSDLGLKVCGSKVPPGTTKPAKPRKPPNKAKPPRKSPQR